MRLSNHLILFSTHLALSIAAGCGDADACVGTEICTTATFTTPTPTTITTCRIVSPAVRAKSAAPHTVRPLNVDRLTQTGRTARRIMAHAWQMRTAATETSVWTDFVLDLESRLSRGLVVSLLLVLAGVHEGV
ncbi:hypothetical protein N7524_012260 [Penicillium chrysogenum]|nr:hypothetical protein N7524_012260 [Penicillium chrysogenum]